MLKIQFEGAMCKLNIFEGCRMAIIPENALRLDNYINRGMEVWVSREISFKFPNQTHRPLSRSLSC